MRAEDINRWLKAAYEEILALKDVLNDRGVSYFQRPLGMGVVLILASYFYGYKLPLERLESVNQDLKAAEATAKYADTYKELHERLNHLYESLPPSKGADSWLLDTVRESLREEGIVPTSFSPPEQNVSDGYRFISLSVRCDASYRKLAMWIARLEREKNLLYIKSLSLNKKETPIGVNGAEVTIMTVVPEKAEL